MVDIGKHSNPITRAQDQCWDAEHERDNIKSFWEGLRRMTVLLHL